MLISASFSDVKIPKISLKIASKNPCFFDIDFYAISGDFGSILGSKNRSEIAKHWKNASSETLSGPPLVSSCFLDGF